MPLGNIGYSRDIPLAGDAGSAKGPSGASSAPRGASPQEAVKLLSLRVPERPSQGALAPVSLLTSRGSQAPGASGLDSLIAALMQAFQTPSSVPALPSGTGNTSGWMNNERNLGGGGGDSPSVVQPSGIPDNWGFPTTGSMAPDPRTSTPPPHFTPGDVPDVRGPGGIEVQPVPNAGSQPVPYEPPIDMTPTPEPAPSLFEPNGPDWLRDKYEFGDNYQYRG